MSAATSQPIVGQSKSAAPFGAVALIAGVLTLGAIGIALGQSAKVTPAAGAVPADVQAALIAQRMGEKASLATAADARLIQHQGDLADRLGAYATSDPRLVQHMGELQDRIAGAIVYGSIRTPDGLVFGRPAPVAPIVRTLPDGRIVDLHSSMTGSDARVVQPVGEHQDRFAAAMAADAYLTFDGRVFGEPGAITEPRVVQHPGEQQDRFAAAMAADTYLTFDGRVLGEPGAITDPRVVQHLGELQDRFAAAGAAGTYVTSDGRVIGRPRAIPVKPSVYVLPNGRIIPMRPTHVGPQTAAQKGLVAALTVNPFAGKAADDAALTVNPFAGKAAEDAALSASRVTYSGKTRDALSGTVAPNRWTILATNPYSQGLLSGGATASAAFATGGMRYDHR